MDPSKFDNKEAFFKAYTESYGRAKAFQEIVDMLAGSEARINSITKAMDPSNKYEI